MELQEITRIGKTLAQRRMKSKLFKLLRIERPTLAWDTIDRAFDPGIALSTKSDIFPIIWTEGQKMLEQDDLRIAREKAALEQQTIESL